MQSQMLAEATKEISVFMLQTFDEFFWTKENLTQAL
jgi:hypothetical protein